MFHSGFLTAEDTKVQSNAFSTAMENVSIKQICPHEIIDSGVKRFNSVVYKISESDLNEFGITTEKHMLVGKLRKWIHVFYLYLYYLYLFLKTKQNKNTKHVIIFKECY